MPDCTVGVDISKTHLDACMAPAGKAARFTNDSAGFNALIAWIDQPVRSVVYEPTGPWHRAFEEALLQAGLPLARANPLQARRFAQAMGQRAKTDAVDARVLAQMGTALPLRPTAASPPTHRALEELQVARDALVTDRTAARNRQKHLRHPLLKQQSKTRLSQIDRHLAAVDAAIGKGLAEDVVLARRTEILTSIPGVSSITAGGPAHPDARTRPPRRQGGRQPGGSRAGHAPVRRLAGPQLHPGRPTAGAAASLHAGPGGDPLQPWPACEVPPAPRPGEAAEGRSDRRHAQAPPAGQCPARTEPLLVARPARARQRGGAGGKRAVRRRMTSPWAPRLAGRIRAGRRPSEVHVRLRACA